MKHNKIFEALFYLSKFFHFEKHDVIWVMYMRILQLQLATDANKSLTINHI